MLHGMCFNADKRKQKTKSEEKGGIAVSRMMKRWSMLLVLLVLLPLTAMGDELMQLYLSRSSGGDYAAYLDALDEKVAVAETAV